MFSFHLKMNPRIKKSMFWSLQHRSVDFYSSRTPFSPLCLWFTREERRFLLGRSEGNKVSGCSLPLREEHYRMSPWWTRGPRAHRIQPQTSIPTQGPPCLQRDLIRLAFKQLPGSLHILPPVAWPRACLTARTRHHATAHRMEDTNRTNEAVTFVSQLSVKAIRHQTASAICIPEMFGMRPGSPAASLHRDVYISMYIYIYILWIHIQCYPSFFLRCLWIPHAAAVVTAAQARSLWRRQPARKDVTDAQRSSRGRRRCCMI